MHAVLGLWLVTGCAPAERSPNVLLLVVDTLRADHIGAYGYARPTTPNLDAFAAGGRVYETVRADSSWTKPSMASLLTGLDGFTHGVAESGSTLPSAAHTLAEAFYELGYATALFSENPYVSRVFGFGQGYRHVYDYASRPARGTAQPDTIEVDGATLRGDNRRDWAGKLGAADLNRRLRGWLATLGTTPWFAHVQYMDPHWPYRGPAEWLDRFRAEPGAPPATDVWALGQGIARVEAGESVSPGARQDVIDLYDGTIALWDSEFGRLIEALGREGRLANTLVIVTSDHGEGFFAHGLWGHRNSLYDELVRVPLVLRGPGIAPGREPRPALLRGVAASALAVAGAPDEVAAGFGPRLAETHGLPWAATLHRSQATYRATLVGDRKWIFTVGGDGPDLGGASAAEAYALGDDPDEQRDRAAEWATHASAARAQLERLEAAAGSASLRGESLELTPSLEQALEALGYAE